MTRSDPLWRDEAPAQAPRPGTALCLSGGGYRAMMFHLGVLWRLYESGHLLDLQRVSSVSGGSIVAAHLAVRWSRLQDGAATPRETFLREMVAPVRAMAGRTIDWPAIVLGLVWPGGAGGRIAAAYGRHLLGGATLQDLPDRPRFVINATNVQSGALWRFSKPYMRDWRVGEVKSPATSLADAVAASSAFPPLLSPFTLRLDPAAFTPGSGDGLQFEPYTRIARLTDGGVYDNLGVETAWKACETVLVSDAGGLMSSQPSPARDWIRHSRRVLDVVDNQVRNLRKRQVIGSYLADPADAAYREGAYWGIRTDIARYGLEVTLPCPHVRTLRLADIPTRLKRLAPVEQERLVNWGYAVSDAALRRHVDPDLPPPADFPYPAAGV